MKRSLPVLLVVAFAALLTGGCRSSYDNNYLRPEDFATYLKKAGIKVTHVRPLPGEPFRATSGAGILIDNSEIGVYKFDPTSASGKKRLDQVTQNKRLYIKGLPFPVEVRGSFAIMGLEKHHMKRKIIKVFDKFY
jgi:hypothetical protein